MGKTLCFVQIAQIVKNNLPEKMKYLQKTHNSLWLMYVLTKPGQEE